MPQPNIRIYQTPIEALPEDLYIPPQAFAIWLEQFEGPLDFLLYLVKKNNFDITETAILPITEQYLAYINELDADHFELAGDYLLMASTLIAIKTEMLLPKPEVVDDEQDPKAELIARLEDYAQIKEASRRLDDLVRLERDVFLAFASLPSDEAMQAVLPTYSPDLLIDSLLKMQLKPDYQMNTHTIAVDVVPLADRIASITRQLSDHKPKRFVDVLDASQGKLGIVVSFVAVLELMKRQLVDVAMSDQMDVADSDHASTHTANAHHPASFTLSNLTLQWVA